MNPAIRFGRIIIINILIINLISAGVCCFTDTHHDGAHSSIWAEALHEHDLELNDCETHCTHTHTMIADSAICTSTFAIASATPSLLPKHYIPPQFQNIFRPPIT